MPIGIVMYRKFANIRYVDALTFIEKAIKNSKNDARIVEYYGDILYANKKEKDAQNLDLPETGLFAVSTHPKGVLTKEWHKYNQQRGDVKG